MTVAIAAQKLARIEQEALAALPRECCGLIEGVREADRITALVLHPTRNVATADDTFEIDPAEQFKLLRALRGTGRAIVGCYHSHPNGRAEPSLRDCGNAGEEGFVWLVAAIRDSRAEFGAFVWQGDGFAAVPLRVEA